jgi:hypothetical protein
MLINVDHFNYYDYITNSNVVMQIDNSNYQLTNGDPGAATITTNTFTNTPAK